MTGSAIVAKTNLLFAGICGRDKGSSSLVDDMPHIRGLRLPSLNLYEELAIEEEASDLLGRLDLLLFQGRLLAEFKQDIVDHINFLPSGFGESSG